MLPRYNKIIYRLFGKLCFTLAVYISVFASQQELSLQIAGMKVQGGRSTQQDVFYVRPKEKAAEDGYCAGVFDGHDDDEINIADTVEKLFRKYFKKHPFKESIEKYLVFIFKCVNDRLRELNKRANFSGQVNESGSTALIAYKLGTFLYIAYLGRNRALWGKNVLEQTVDHSTENEKELNHYESDEYWFDSEDEITRLNVGLNVTRALGDFTAETLTGWRAEPEINRIDLQKNSIIIMGSDGFWNTINLVWKDKSFRLDNNKTVAYDIAESNFKSNQSPADVVCKKLIRQAITLPYDGKTEVGQIIDQKLNDDKFIGQYEGLTLGDNTTVVVIHATVKENEKVLDIKSSKIDDVGSISPNEEGEFGDNTTEFFIHVTAKKNEDASNIKPSKNNDAGSISPNEKDKIENNKTVIEPENDKVKIVNIDKEIGKNKPTENLSNKRSVTFMHIAVMLFLCGIIGYGYWQYHAQNIYM